MAFTGAIGPRPPAPGLARDGVVRGGIGAAVLALGGQKIGPSIEGLEDAHVADLGGRSRPFKDWLDVGHRSPGSP